MITNVYKVGKIMFILLILFHVLACVWIYIGNGPEGWRKQMVYAPYQE